MDFSLSESIAELSCLDYEKRLGAATRIYGYGRSLADGATRNWKLDAELFQLLSGPAPEVTVGLAVSRETFKNIHEANDAPRLAHVPAEQDAEEFELQFAGTILLDVLTSREPKGMGAIARYLAKFGEGVQQVEFRCLNVNRAAEILRSKFGANSVYPHARAGANGTHINFFLIPSSGGGKLLLELYETAAPDR